MSVQCQPAARGAAGLGRQAPRTRVLVIVGLVAVAVVGLGARGLAVRPRVHPRHRPHPPHLNRPAPRRPPELLRRHVARRPTSIGWPPAPPSSPARTPTRQRACRRTRRCSPASCRSTTASATTSASRSPPTLETLASRLGDRGFETAAAVSTFLLRAETGLDAGFAHYDAERPAPATDGAGAAGGARQRRPRPARRRRGSTRRTRRASSTRCN